MPLAAGTRLGPYEVLGLIGAGGMGQVYRARDARLDRTVAIKVLPEDVAGDPDLLRQFEREALALAALNHPNILTIHDVGSHGGPSFVVTELLEGETLRETISRRTPTHRQLIAFAVQAAHGLAAAHRAGVVHRDVKPENVFITTDGRVKVLDFGLAGHAGTRGATDTTTAGLVNRGVVMGTIAYMSPEQAHGRPAGPPSDVFSFGVVLYEMLTRRQPFHRETWAATLTAILIETPPPPSSVNRSIPPALDGIVRRCLEKDPAARFASGDGLVAALEAVLQLPSHSVSLQDVEECSPYPGLRSFTEGDARMFFGRESEVEALWTRIRARRLLGVIGPSGAGKTSFLRAGLAPARPDDWAAIVCTPGTAPLRGLGHALGPALAGDAEALGQLAGFEEPDTAFALVSRWRQAHADALLIVDQFEELFTLNPPETQARFASLIARLAGEADVHVVLSLRDDFLMRCHEHACLGPVFDDLTPLGALSQAGLRRALVEPAARLGYRFEDPALVEDMVACVEGTRAALPLLAFAVSRLWERRDRKRRILSRGAYEAIGGVAGALAQHAEATLDRIGAARQDLVRDILRNLVTSHGTRSVIDRDELLSAFPHRETAESVLRELVDARLLTSYEVEGHGGEASRQRIEIVHESLLKAWPRLVRWQMQDEDGAQLRDQLKQAAHLWAEKGRTTDLLWTGTAYREYALWRERYGAPLTAIEDAFAAAMAARARRKKRLLAAAVAVVIVGLSAVALAIGLSRQTAIESARRAEASRLVALGRVELDRYPTAAVAYARKSLEMSDTTEARLLALEALWRGPGALLLNLPPGAACSRLALSPDGNALACAGFSDKVVVWSAEGHEPTVYGGLPIVADARAVTFDARGEHVISWVPGDPALRVWSLPAGTMRTFPAAAEWVRPVEPGYVAVLGPVAPGNRQRVLRRWSLAEGTATELARWMPPPGMRLDQPGLRPVRFDPLLGWLAFGDGGDVVLTALGGKGDRNRRLHPDGSRIREVEFDAAGRRLVSADEAGLFCLWSVADGTLLRTTRTAALHRYSLPVFSPDGSFVSWMSGDGTTHLWDLRAPADASPLALRRTDVRDAGDEAFSVRGGWLASAAWASVALWPLDTPRAVTLAGHGEGPIHDVAFSPDSSLLVSCARDGAITWPLDGSRGGARRVDLGSDYYCYGVTFAPDGQRFALNSPYLGAYLVPLQGGPARLALDFRGTRAAPMPLAFDATGRTLASAPMYSATDADMLLSVRDLERGTLRTFPLRESGTGDGYEASVSYLKYQANGALLIAGSNGIRRWDPTRGRIEPVLWGKRFAAVDVDRTGRLVVALTGDLSASRLRLFDPELLVLDESGRTVRTIRSHGNALTPTLAVDAAGRFIVTGDANGIVRIGSVTGGEPHMLLGHSGPVNRVAVSSDGQWIASASGREIRLWRMPDLSRPPLHGRPYSLLMETLAGATNLQVIADPASPTGYRTDVGPFPGWKKIPTW